MPFTVVVVLEGYALGSYLTSRRRIKYLSLLRWGEILLILGILQGLRTAIDPPRFDGLTVCLMGLTILAWRLGVAAVGLFSQIDAPLSERADRQSLPKRLGVWLIVGFLFLLAVTSVTQPWGVVALGLSPHTVSGPVGMLLLYGVIGVLFLAYTQYQVNRRGWRDGDVAVSPRVRPMWASSCAWGRWTGARPRLPCASQHGTELCAARQHLSPR